MGPGGDEDLLRIREEFRPAGADQITTPAPKAPPLLNQEGRHTECPNVVRSPL
jgi:hypothetical protein